MVREVMNVINAMVPDVMNAAFVGDNKADEDWMMNEDQRLLDEERATKPKWFRIKEEALCQGKLYGDQCIIARDVGDKKNFATIPDSRWLPNLIDATAVPERVFYECFTIGTLFKGYLDLEYFYDSTEYAGAHLTIVLKKLSHALREYFPEHLSDDKIPVFGILDATRPLPDDDPSGKPFKISYHILFQNLLFKSPVLLGRFVKWFVAKETQLEAGSRTQRNDEELVGGLDRLLRDYPPHMIVDLKPYGKFQQMRMPLSAKVKGGIQSVLRGLVTDFDPFTSQLPDCKFSEDAEAHKDLFLRLVNETSSFIEKQTVDNDYSPPADIVPAIQNVLPKSTRTQRVAGRAPGQCRGGECVTVPASVALAVGDRLREHGITSHSVQGPLVENPNHSFCIPLSVKSDDDGQRRCPLLQRGEKAHTSNNQRVLVRPDGKLKVMCHSARCEGRRLSIGKIPETMMDELRYGGDGKVQSSNGRPDSRVVVSGEDDDSDSVTRPSSPSTSHNETRDSDHGDGGDDERQEFESDGYSSDPGDDGSHSDYGQRLSSDGDDTACALEGCDYNLSADEEYSQDSMRPFPTDKKVIVVQAGMGVGKSVQERCFVKNLAQECGFDQLAVVKVSFRKTFTVQETNKLRDDTGLPFVSHDHVEGIMSLTETPFIVIQYESLHRLLPLWKLGNRKLVLLVDEWNSIARQMESSAGIPAQDLLMFQTLVDCASHCIFMDACTTIHSIQACEAFAKQKPHVIVNHFQKHMASGTQLIPYDDYEFMLRRVHSRLDEGGSTVVVTHGKKVANKIFHGIKNAFPGKRVLLYTGDTSAETKANDFRDVNLAWADADAVIYNSTCEAGVSCIDPRFEDVFAFFSPDILCAQASFQMVGRIRSIKRLHVHVKFKGHAVSQVEFPIQKEDIFALYRSFHRPLPPNLVPALRGTAQGMTIEDTPFASILFANARHRNASRRSFRSTFLRLCQSSGMILQPTVTVTQDRDRATELATTASLARADEEKAQQIAGSMDIDSEEAETIKMKRDRTDAEEHALKKFYLAKTFRVDPESIDSEFVQTYNDDAVKRAYHNLRELRSFGIGPSPAIDKMKEHQAEQVETEFESSARKLVARSEEHGGEAALRGWHEVSRERSEAHKAVHQLLGKTTGLDGVHCAENYEGALVSAKDMRKRLGYPVGKRGGVSKKGAVSEDVVTELENLRMKLQEHIPFCRIAPFQGTVKFKRVVKTLNSVLAAMYGMSFCRTDDPGCTFQLEKNKLFMYPGADLGGELRPKPELQAWGHAASRKRKRGESFHDVEEAVVEKENVLIPEEEQQKRLRRAESDQIKQEELFRHLVEVEKSPWGMWHAEKDRVILEKKIEREKRTAQEKMREVERLQRRKLGQEGQGILHFFPRE